MQENMHVEQKDIIPLVLAIEEKKGQYKKARLPLFWYSLVISITLTFIVLEIIVIGIFGYNAYIVGWTILLLIVCAIILLFLLIYFFPPDGFDVVNKIKNLVGLREDIEGLQTQLRVLQELQSQQQSPRLRYKDELLQTILQYQHQANSYRRTHYTFQILIILFSLFVTALTSGLTNLIGITDKQWITAIISFLVSFLTAMTALFRFHDRGFNLQQTADAIEYEIKNAELQIYDYGPPLSDEDALRKLAERGARLLDEQRKRQLQLEQSSNTKQTTE